MKIRTKIALSVIIASVLLNFIFTYNLINEEREKEYNRLNHKIDYTNQLMAFITSDPLWQIDLENIKLNLESFYQDTEIVLIRIHDQIGVIDFQFGDTKSEDPDQFIVTEVDVKKDESILGKIHVTYTKAVIENRLDFIRNRMIYLTLILLVINSVIIFFISRLFLNPIEKVVNGLNRIDGGDYQYRLNLKTRDEFKDIEFYFNNMVKNIQNEIIFRKQKERELKESEKKYRGIFESTLEGIFQIDDNGRFITINTAFARIFGYKTAADLLAQHKNISTVLEFSSFHEIYQIIEFSEKQHIKDVEIITHKSDGIEMNLMLNMHPLTNEENQALFYQGIIEDITIKKRNQQLRIDKEAAEKANQAKSEFLANMSHEIRTPLNAILGFSEILESVIENQEQKQYLDSISASGKTLLTLINDILDLSKIEAGKLELQYNTMRISNVSEELRTVFALKAESKGIKLIIETSPDLPESIVFDEIRLRQILLNIMGNAVKFTQQGYVKLSIQGNIKQNQPEMVDIYIAVEDTGIGIPADQQESIFQSFTQQKGQSYQQFGGTGLGLAITRRLVNMMNGEISVESHVGVGSVFTLIFKGVKITHFEDKPLKKDQKVQAGIIQFEVKDVLVVDDVDTNRQLIKSFLAKYHFNISEACNGKEAIAGIKEHKPDIIFMDLKMPIMDGFEAIKQIKANEQWKSIPVIAVSASVMNQDSNDVIALGFDHFLHKPLRLNELLNVLKEYIPHEEIGKQDKPYSIYAQLVTDQNYPYLDKMISFLKKDCQEEWKSLKGKLHFQKINIFAQKIKKFSEKYQFALCQDWADKLLLNIKTFNVEQINLLLDQFPGLGEVIEEAGKEYERRK
ncbi:MAG: ATP-binding protein [Spirochaetes bacterium]|nr:ATP-binding protein [Spirochaetota bacterium]